MKSPGYNSVLTNPCRFIIIRAMKRHNERVLYSAVQSVVYQTNTHMIHQEKQIHDFILNALQNNIERREKRRKSLCEFILYNLYECTYHKFLT